MRIISHRGWWKDDQEKNSQIAFQRTVNAGYGTETDVRDYRNKLVVAHDPANEDSLLWSDVLDIFHNTGLTLAVNIKSDGLAPELKRAFSSFDGSWFAFDMSGPETVRYAALELPFYTRHSDIETAPILYNQAAGVWLDAFQAEWFDRSTIERHLANNKNVCIVSPELHGRQPGNLWSTLAGLPDTVMLCTDLPDEAERVIGR